MTPAESEAGAAAHPGPSLVLLLLLLLRYLLIQRPKMNGAEKKCRKNRAPWARRRR